MQVTVCTYWPVCTGVSWKAYYLYHVWLKDLMRFMHVYFFVYSLQALHLVGQALLEEKNQLEACSVEEVTFDFSLKARSMSVCCWGK